MSGEIDQKRLHSDPLYAVLVHFRHQNMVAPYFLRLADEAEERLDELLRAADDAAREGV